MLTQAKALRLKGYRPATDADVDFEIVKVPQKNIKGEIELVEVCAVKIEKSAAEKPMDAMFLLPPLVDWTHLLTA